MNPTASTDTTPRVCLVLVADGPRVQGRVWDFDTGELGEPTQIVPWHGGSCAQCGATEGQMLRVLHQDQALAFCDNGQCAVEVHRVATFRPEIPCEGPAGLEFIGFYSCSCGRPHVIGGPAGNWTLGYCPPPCGRAVLAQPDPALLLEVAS